MFPYKLTFGMEEIKHKTTRHKNSIAIECEHPSNKW